MLTNSFPGLIKNKKGRKNFHVHLSVIFIFTHRNEKVIKRND
jgi:hypothetical protein